MWETIGPLVGVAVGAGLTYWIQRSLAVAATRTRWVDRVADALAGLEILLTDAHPDRMAFNLDRGIVSEQMKDLWERSRTVRREVAVLAVGHPDPDLRAEAKELQVGVFNAIGSLSWFISDMARHRDSADSRAEAMTKHEACLNLAESIANRLHG